jgi:hypothetical protein
MNTEFDELVRDSMRDFTDGVEMPARLAADARQQHRRRQRARTGWLAGGAAVAGATAVTIGVVAAGGVPVVPHHIHSHGGHAARIQTTAVVVDRVEHALATAASGNPVAYTRQTSHGFKLYLAIPHGKPIQVRGTVTSSWSRGPLQHVIVGAAGGKPALSMATDTSSGKSVETSVSYQRRVWWRGTYEAPTPAKPALGCKLGAVDRTPAQWAREVRKLLSCGAKVAGRQRVDGVETIKLKLSSSYRRACAGSSDGGRCHPVPVGWTGALWANAKTFLPVRLFSHGHDFSFQIDFGWLAPTKANLAKLHQPIPAGFRHV